MRAFVLSCYGGSECTALTEVSRPSPGAGELFVRVHAAGLNPVDFKKRAGALKLIRNYPPPIVMGNELSGVVEAVGPGVTHFSKGDRIFARVDKEIMGAFAEYAVTDAASQAGDPRRRDLLHAKEAQIIVERWRRHYNTIRPHASLGYQPPAPEVFVPALTAWPLAQVPMLN